MFPAVAASAVLLTLPALLALLFLVNRQRTVVVERSRPMLVSFPADHRFRRGLIECVYLKGDIVGEVTVNGDERTYEFYDDITGRPHILRTDEQLAVDDYCDSLILERVDPCDLRVDEGLFGSRPWTIEAANESPLV